MSIPLAGCCFVCPRAPRPDGAAGIGSVFPHIRNRGPDDVSEIRGATRDRGIHLEFRPQWLARLTGLGAFDPGSSRYVGRRHHGPTVQPLYARLKETSENIARPRNAQHPNSEIAIVRVCIRALAEIAGSRHYPGQRITEARYKASPLTAGFR